MSTPSSPRHSLPAPPKTMTGTSLSSTCIKAASPSAHLLHGKPETLPGSRSQTPTTFRFPDLKMDAAATDNNDNNNKSPMSPSWPTPSPSPLNMARHRRCETFGSAASTGPLRSLKTRCGVNLPPALTDLALRKYTDYDSHGTPRSPPSSSALLSPSGGGPWTGSTCADNNYYYYNNNNNNNNDDDYHPAPQVLDVFAPATAATALRDPAAAARMRQFIARTRGRDHHHHHHNNNIDDYDDVDFLQRVDAYDRAVRDVGAILADLAGRTPTKHHLQQDHDAAAAHMHDAATTLLPRLAGLFADARARAERAVAAGPAYRDFVHAQLSLSLQTVGAGYSPNQVCAGFGEAFSLTGAGPGAAACVSDGLAGLTGYTVAELVAEQAQRMLPLDVQTQQTQERSELVLQRRRDGRAFWNLVFVARLRGGGELAAHIDVSEMLDGPRHLAYLLGHEPPLVRAHEQQQQQQVSSSSSSSSQRPAAAHPPSVSRNRFLQSFRRRQSSSPSSSADGSSSSTSTANLEQLPCEPSPSPSGHFATLSPCSRFLVMEYDMAGAGGSEKKAQLPVAFCSAAALESLLVQGAPAAAAAVTGTSVFRVLADVSPSVNRSFRAGVRASLAQGRSVKLDVAIANNSHARAAGGGGGPRAPRGLSLSRKGSGVGLAATAAVGEVGNVSRSLRRSLSLERLGGGGGGVAASRDFVSYWTPLKDAEGVTRWVVLMLVPEVA